MPHLPDFNIDFHITRLSKLYTATKFFRMLGGEQGTFRYLRHCLREVKSCNMKIYVKICMLICVEIYVLISIDIYVMGHLLFNSDISMTIWLESVMTR